MYKLGLNQSRMTAYHKAVPQLRILLLTDKNSTQNGSISSIILVKQPFEIFCLGVNA